MNQNWERSQQSAVEIAKNGLFGFGMGNVCCKKREKTSNKLRFHCLSPSNNEFYHRIRSSIASQSINSYKIVHIQISNLCFRCFFCWPPKNVIWKAKGWRGIRIWWWNAIKLAICAVVLRLPFNIYWSFSLLLPRSHHGAYFMFGRQQSQWHCCN